MCRSHSASCSSPSYSRRDLSSRCAIGGRQSRWRGNSARCGRGNKSGPLLLLLLPLLRRRIIIASRVGRFEHAPPTRRAALLSLKPAPQTLEMEDMATWKFLGGISQTKCLAGLRKAVRPECHFWGLSVDTWRIGRHVLPTDDAGAVRHGG